MKLIDMHCDTVYELWTAHNDELNDNPKLRIDIRRLREADSLIQCFALYNDRIGPGQWDEWLAYAAFQRALIEQHAADLAYVTCYDDIARIEGEGRMGAMMTVEDAGVADGLIERLDTMAALGARIISLTWNGETCFAYPNSAEPAQHARGLKPLGREAVERLDALGVLLDVSHLSRGGTLEAVALSRKPVVASHSNARALASHQRNLTDEEICAIADTGGVIGVNFVPKFLNDDGAGRLADVARHIRYLADVGGTGVVAFGSDFDGYSSTETELVHMGDMPRLYEDLQTRGFSHAFLEGLFHKNALRVFRDVLG